MPSLGSGIRVVMMKSFNVRGTGIQKLYKICDDPICFVCVTIDGDDFLSV